MNLKTSRMTVSLTNPLLLFILSHVWSFILEARMVYGGLQGQQKVFSLRPLCMVESKVMGVINSTAWGVLLLSEARVKLSLAFQWNRYFQSLQWKISRAALALWNNLNSPALHWWQQSLIQHIGFWKALYEDSKDSNWLALTFLKITLQYKQIFNFKY